jgi:hypothetical protein
MGGSAAVDRGEVADWIVRVPICIEHIAALARRAVLDEQTQSIRSRLDAASAVQASRGVDKRRTLGRPHHAHGLVESVHRRELTIEVTRHRHLAVVLAPAADRFDDAPALRCGNERERSLIGSHVSQIEEEFGLSCALGSK